MKVLLIGTGAVGSVISKLLAKDESISEIRCGSRNVERAKNFIDVKNHKIELIKLDASDQAQISKAAKDFDLIINASLPNFNESIMKAAVKVGSDYLDLCSHLLDLKTPEQLQFSRSFQREALTGLINAGVSPGVTNLLARDSADKLDSVSDIKIRCIEDQKASELIFAWSPEVTLDELTSPPLAYRNGRFVLLTPFTDSEEFEFPSPFGKRQVVNIYGDEVSTIPLYIRTRNVDYKSCGTDVDLSKALFRLGLFSKKPLLIRGSKVVPIEFFSMIAPSVPTPEKMISLIKEGIIENATFILVVEVAGKEGGKDVKIRSAAIFPDLMLISKIFPGATYISYPTSVSAVAFSKIIQDVDTHGVLPPEALESEVRKKVMIDLENSGVIINEQFSK